MTREETVKILAILKSAYPNSYKGMSKDEANGIVMVWASQFANMPADIVLIAVNKLISSSPFPPAICDVKNKIRGLYYEAWGELKENEYLECLDDSTKKQLERIVKYTETMRVKEKTEPSLTELLNGYSQKYLIGEQNND